MSQRDQINVLREQVRRLSRLKEGQSFQEVSKEVQLLFKKIELFSYSSEVSSNFIKTDTLDIFTVKWIDSLTTPQSILADRNDLEKWLKERLDLDTLVVRNKQ